MAIKQCVVCGGDFRVRSTKKTCSKKCVKEKNRKNNREAVRKRRAADPEKFREVARKRYAANPEKFREAARDKNAKLYAAVRIVNEMQKADNVIDVKREKNREDNRRWRAANPEHVRELGRRWRAANPEHVRELVRRWRAANPETNCNTHAKRIAALRIVKKLQKGIMP